MDALTYSIRITTIVALVFFATFKLLGLIDWSWWWVLSPIWISGIAVIMFLLIMTVYILLKNN